jgi:opacity protein-like surface antigen
MTRAIRLILLFWIVIPSVFAQIHPYFGVDAGVPLTDTLLSSSYFSSDPSGTDFERYNSKTKRLLIGPTFRVDLVRGLGLEFDVLYQRINYDYASLNSGSGYLDQTFQQNTANRWQFPVLVQYKFAVWKASLFFEAGPSISHITAATSNMTETSYPPTSTVVSTGTGQPMTLAGFTTGAGVDIPWRRFHMRPEFRYSRWFMPASVSPVLTAAAIANTLSSSGFLTTAPPAALNFNQNEVSFLLGLTF